MGLITRLGQWLDARFPEKVSAEAVYARLSVAEENAIQANGGIQALETRLGKLESVVLDLSKKVEVLTSENTAMKTSLAIRTRVSSSLPIPGR